MKLIFLHGAPATGKLTVATALLRVVPGRLLDNHAAIDFALTMFDFGAPGFWDLVHDVRLSALDAAAQHGSSGWSPRSATPSRRIVLRSSGSRRS
jgi:hypothetical protein